MKNSFFTASLCGAFYLLFVSVFAAEEQAHSFRDTALKTYNEAWDMIGNSHYAPDEKRWAELRKANEEKAASCKNEPEFLAFMNNLFNELGQSHIALLSPEGSHYVKAIRKIAENTEKKEVQPEKKGSSSPRSALPDIPGEAGFLPLLADGRICVGKVFHSSAAEDAGMKPGEEIVRINSFKFDFDLSARSDIPWELVAHKMLSGRAGRELVIKTKTLSGEEKEYQLKLKSIGTRWIRLGAMPRFAGFFYHEILPGNIGYVYFNSFFPDEISSFNALLSGEFEDVDGIIIDLRNNPGGMGVLAPSLGGWLSDKSLAFGIMQTRDVPLKLVSNPQPAAFTGPLAVLINKGTASTSEIFAAGIQDNKRGIVIGETSSGQCLLSTFYLLSTGYRLQAVFGDFIRLNGARVEKIGAIPDLEVKNTRESLSSGHDLPLDQAVKYINSNQ